MSEVLKQQARYPAAGQKQLWTILLALRRREKLTVMVALQDYGCYALSQRIGDLKGLGWPIQNKMIEVDSGKHVAEYWIDHDAA